jgi:hypothetical protein
MDFQKAIGWGVLIIFGYYIVREFIQFIIIGVFVMVAYQAYKNSQKPPRS